MHSRRFMQIALLVGAAALLTGCETIQKAAGNGKDSPDEFAVVTKAPLVIPPDFNLKPPAPGTEPTNQVEPTQAAENALFGSDPATVASSLPATMSDGERYLLAYARVQDADPAIRQELASDIRGMRGADDSFTNDVLFWTGPSTGGKPVDADAEARRIDAERTGGAPPAAGAPPAPSAPPPPADDSTSDDGGWLDNLWPF
ncbi:MAG: DUF3035 domain-containing protein [Proteobacteria bacterium]|nr:DUF3035 domain-containing protein [Pseudomonadota bacterium]